MPKYIIEIRESLGKNLSDYLGIIDPGGTAPVRIAQDGHGRTAGMDWVEQCYEVELRTQMPGILPWADLPARTQEGIGEILAGQPGWQFSEAQPLDAEAVSKRIAELHPEVMLSPFSSEALLRTGVLRCPDLGDLLESVVEIITGDVVPRRELIQNGIAAGMLEASGAFRRELLLSRERMTFPADILPGIEDVMNDEAHRIARGPGRRRHPGGAGPDGRRAGK